MPEFIGRPKLPEQLAAMRLQMAQRNPTADALNELSKSIQSALQTYSEHDMKAKLQKQLLGAEADQARAAAEAANERFQMGQRGATIRGMIREGWTPTAGSAPIQRHMRIGEGTNQWSQFSLGPEEIQTQQFPSSPTIMQLTDLLQAQGIRPRAGDPSLAFRAPEPKPVMEKAAEFVVQQGHVDRTPGYGLEGKLGKMMRHADYNTILRDISHARFAREKENYARTHGGSGMNEKRLELMARNMASDHVDDYLNASNVRGPAGLTESWKKERARLIDVEAASLLGRPLQAPQLPSVASKFMGMAFGNRTFGPKQLPRPSPAPRVGPNYTAEPDPEVDLQLFDEDEE